MSVLENRVISPQGRERSPANAVERTQLVTARAAALLDQYRTLPWHASSNRHKAEMFSRDIAREFLREPTIIDLSMTTWLSGSPTRDKSSRRLVADIEEQMTLLQSREEGRHISSQFLEELIRSSVHNPILENFALGQLRTFFSQPTNEEESVAAVLKLADAMIDLCDDRESLKLAARIAKFDTDILPYDGATNAYFAVASFGDPNITDPELETELYQETRIVDLIVSNVPSLVFDPNNDLLKKQRVASNGRPSPIAMKVNERHRDFIKRNGLDALMEIFESKNDSLNADLPLPSIDSLADLANPAYVEAEKTRSAQHLRFNPDHPVWHKYMQRLGAVFTERNWIERIQASFASDLEPITISVGGKYSATFILDESMNREGITAMLKEPQTLQDLLSAAVSSLEEQEARAGDILVSMSRNDRTGIIIPLSIRVRSIYEQPSHPAEQLARTGVGVLLTMTENMDTVSQIQNLVTNQIRYLNTRWVSVPVDRSWLGDVGYESIDFRMDPHDRTKIMARIKANGNSHELRLDDNFEIDLEGMAFDHPRLRLALHNILLRILGPILCEEEVRDNDDNVTDLKKLFVSRIGHLRWLPEGQQIGLAQIKAFREIQGQDLLEKSAKRKAQQNTTRNTTYVKPQESNDNPYLPPIVAHLPIEALL